MKLEIVNRSLIRGGSRGLPNILVVFSEKPYEIKEILVRRGARAGGAPSKSATVNGSVFLSFIVQALPELAPPPRPPPPQCSQHDLINQAQSNQHF